MCLANVRGLRPGSSALRLSEALFLHDFDFGLDPALDLILT